MSSSCVYLLYLLLQRFVEFRRLRVAEALEESLRWEVSGFAVDDDAKPEVLAPWIPLRAG